MNSAFSEGLNAACSTCISGNFSLIYPLVYIGFCLNPFNSCPALYLKLCTSLFSCLIARYALVFSVCVFSNDSSSAISVSSAKCVISHYIASHLALF
jgi:hypothetical protein